MMHTFDPILSSFKYQAPPSPTATRYTTVDVNSNTRNIFHNNVLYFQRCKDLEVKVDYLEKLNSFLISQVLQSLSTAKCENSMIQKHVEQIRKKSMKFEDDRCLNKTFQLYKIYKGLLDSAGDNLAKVSGMFFPANFDFEQALYTKHHQKIINLVLKSAINSIISLRDEVKNVKSSVHMLGKKLQMCKDTTPQQNTSLMMKHPELNSFKSHASHASRAESDPGDKGARIIGATGERSLVQPTLSDNLSLSMNRLGLVDDPMFSDSFLNATDIKNNILRPFQLGSDNGKADKSVQVSFDHRSPEESDSNHFSVV